MRKHRPAGRLAGLLLALAVLTALIPVPASAAVTAHFADVPSGHWAYQYVERAYADGAIVGTGGDPASGTGTFTPDASMTYGQFLTMLVNAFYPEELARCRQAGDPWYMPALRVAEDRQLTNMSLDQLTQESDSPIDRYNAAWILVRLLDDKCVVLPDEEERAAAAAKIGDWDKLYTREHWRYFVSSIYAMGIISGVDSNGTFAGKQPITRSSAAVIYARTADKIKSSGGDLKAFQITFEGDWSAAPEGLAEELEKEFYIVYPRMWARWGTAEVGKHVVVRLVPGEEIDNVLARTSGTRDEVEHRDTPLIRLSTEYMTSNSISHQQTTFAHELVHVSMHAAFRNIKVADRRWLSECLSDYGAFRYASWADEQYQCMKHYYQPGDEALRTWNYEPYGDSYWFFAWMDQRWPTTKDGYGLIDSILLGIQKKEIATASPSDPSFNAVFQQVTGHETIEALRQQYVKELDAGTWTFTGFAGYADNYLTEDLPGVPDPTYPAQEDFDLRTGAYTINCSGAAPGHPADDLLDGDRTTGWEASPSDVTDRSKLNGGKEHRVNITLGKRVTISGYTLYHAGSPYNTDSWRITYYDKAKEKWLVLDEVRGNKEDVTTRTFAPVQAINLILEILESNQTGDGTVRLYELELFNKG